MSLDVYVTVEGRRSPLGRAAIADVARSVLRADRVRAAMVSVTLLDGRAMARINAAHLGHSGPTDVISFGFNRATPRDPVIGDIYICPDVAREHAAARGIGIRQELTRLVVHGVLHILGYDHPTDGGREISEMWKRQEKLVRRVFQRGTV